MELVSVVFMMGSVLIKSMSGRIRIIPIVHNFGAEIQIQKSVSEILKEIILELKGHTEMLHRMSVHLIVTICMRTVVLWLSSTRDIRMASGL